MPVCMKHGKKSEANKITTILNDLENNVKNEMNSELQLPVGIEHGKKAEANVIATTRMTNNLWSYTSTTTNLIDLS